MSVHEPQQKKKMLKVSQVTTTEKSLIHNLPYNTIIPSSGIMGQVSGKINWWGKSTWRKRVFIFSITIIPECTSAELFLKNLKPWRNINISKIFKSKILCLIGFIPYYRMGEFKCIKIGWYGIIHFSL